MPPPDRIASMIPAKPLQRDPETIKREELLKRDALHIFRRFQTCSSREEKTDLCGEASALFDSIASRVGEGMAALTSGRIIFCNALMDCGGLDALQDCKDLD